MAPTCLAGHRGSYASNGLRGAARLLSRPWPQANPAAAAPGPQALEAVSALSPDPSLYAADGDNLAAQKHALRRATKSIRRKAAAADRAVGGQAAHRLRDRFLEAAPALAGFVVSGYWPMGDEIDPRPLLQALSAAGCRLALPALRGPGQALDFRAWTPGDALVPAAFGTQEPAPDTPVLRPRLLLVPLLAFDAEGYRLGYGGGFYDRSLASLRAQGDILAVGLAFATQAVAAVPRDGNDQRLDWLVTERAVIRP